LANTRVSLLRYCKTAGGWRRMRVSTIRKGRGWDEKIETSHAIIEKGEYQLRWYTGSKPNLKGIGYDLSDASSQGQSGLSLALENAAKLLVVLSSGCCDKGTDRARASRRRIHPTKTNTVRRGECRLQETIDAYKFIIDEFLRSPAGSTLTKSSIKTCCTISSSFGNVVGRTDVSNYINRYPHS